MATVKLLWFPLCQRAWTWNCRQTNVQTTSSRNEFISVPIISAVSWKINWILDYFWIPYLLINQQHYPLYRTKSYLFMYFQRNTRTNLPPFSVKMQVYFKTASHNPHSIPVKLQQHITSALFDGMDKDASDWRVNCSAGWGERHQEDASSRHDGEELPFASSVMM